MRASSTQVLIVKNHGNLMALGMESGFTIAHNAKGNIHKNDTANRKGKSRDSQEQASTMACIGTIRYVLTETGERNGIDTLQKSFSPETMSK